MKQYRELPYADREEWLALRRQYIGGSDAGAVVGLNPYKSPLTLWAEKTGQIEEFKGNLTTEVGAYLEDFVARKWAEKTGKQIRRKNRIIVNDLYPWACANVDRMVVGENAALEVKTTNSWPILRAIRNGGEEFPDLYYAQCLHYMGVANLDRMYLAVLAEGRELLCFSMDRDQAEIDALMEAEGRFWKLVQDNTPPPLDGMESTGATLHALHPTADDDRIDLTALNATLEDYLVIGRQIKVLKKAQEEAANTIKAALGSHAGGEAPCAKVTWSNGSTTRFLKDVFLADHAGQDLSRYFETKNSRNFRVTERK